jgi:peroxiredoxin
MTDVLDRLRAANPLPDLEMAGDLAPLRPRTEHARRRAPAKRIVLAVCIALAMSASALAATRTWTSLDRAVDHGRRPPAPDQVLPVLGHHGSTSSLSDYRGRIVILSFWASWCAPCREQAHTLDDVAADLRARGKGDAMLVGAYDSSREALAFVKDTRLRLPVLEDPDGRLARRYDAKALPSTFVIDGAGRVVAISRRPVTRGFLMRAVRRAGELAGTLRK